MPILKAGFSTLFVCLFPVSNGARHSGGIGRFSPRIVLIRQIVALVKARVKRRAQHTLVPAMDKSQVTCPERAISGFSCDSSHSDP